jgi:hypothetical protein
MRIVFQDLKIGLRHEQILGFLSPTSLKTFNECTNLKAVCDNLCRVNSKDKQSDLAKTQEGMGLGLQLFKPLSPMLSKGFPRSNCGQIASAGEILTTDIVSQ